MRRGLFAVYPRGRGGCSGYCPFQEICRYAEWRVDRKWDLHPIVQLDLIADADEGGEDEA